MIKVDDQRLDKMAKIVRKFLLDNGGAYNGLDTYVKGKVTPDDAGDQRLEWSTPEMDKLTILEIRKRGRQLYEKVRKAALLTCDDEFAITLEAVHLEWGCYSTHIIVSSYGYPVELDD